MLGCGCRYLGLAVSRISGGSEVGSADVWREGVELDALRRGRDAYFAAG